jgi:hypothetical protein
MDKKKIDINTNNIQEDHEESSLNLFSLDDDSNTLEIEDSYDINRIKSIMESALFVAGNAGLGLSDLKKVTNISIKEIKKILKE